MTTPTPTSPPASSGGIFFLCGFLIVAVGIGLVSTSSSVKQSATTNSGTPVPVPDSVKAVHPSNTPGLHNVYRLGESLYSGSSPEDEAAFKSLSRLGIKTVICVDGLGPDLQAGSAHGLRSVHLPISYSQISHETLIGLVRTTRELPGPYYLYCHHGKNRGPAAAVVLWRCLDKHITKDQAAAALTAMGTAERFHGLFTSVRDAVCPSGDELKGDLEKLPESSPVASLAKSMAVIDRMWDRVSVPVTDRNSTTISNQMNLAYDIAEQFRESSSLPAVTEEVRPGFQATADALDRLAEFIKAELRNPTNGPDAQREEAVTKVKNLCRDCHLKYRDQ